MILPTSGYHVASEAIGVSGLAGRYATALFELAVEQDALDAVANDLASLRAMLDESADLRRLVASPVIGREDQGRAMVALAARANFGALAGKFIGLLASNRRLFALADTIRAYDTLVAARRGEVTADVTSARALSDAQTQALITSLKNATGREVRLMSSVDETLIGGLVVKVGSRMIDASLKSKLQSLRLVMKGAA
jgi:F-type H+-transporting ATPase subunit delta